MPLENITLKGIDNYLNALSGDVGENNIEIFKKTLGNNNDNNSKFLNIYRKSLKSHGIVY